MRLFSCNRSLSDKVLESGGSKYYKQKRLILRVDYYTIRLITGVVSTGVVLGVLDTDTTECTLFHKT